jgi:hypothetical protein
VPADRVDEQRLQTFAVDADQIELQAAVDGAHERELRRSGESAAEITRSAVTSVRSRPLLNETARSSSTCERLVPAKAASLRPRPLPKSIRGEPRC